MNEMIEQIATHAVDSAIRIHRTLGPGLFESVYESALAFELTELGHQVERQSPVPMRYKGLVMQEGFRADLLVDESFLIEIKSLENLAPVHFKQVLTYLRLLN